VTLLEQLDQVEERMEKSLEKERFDTFNQLSAERFSLLKLVLQVPENEGLIEPAREKTERWVELFNERLAQARKKKQLSESMGDYSGGALRPGRVLNRSL
jgi:hypothetical protein